MNVLSIIVLIGFIVFAGFQTKKLIDVIKERKASKKNESNKSDKVE